MSEGGIEVIATTMSGSIKDWGKVERIKPLFNEYGRDDVAVHAVDSHAEARALTRDLVMNGARTLISAGGSGTFNSVLEGCIDSRVGLANITLGFLRKGIGTYQPNAREVWIAVQHLRRRFVRNDLPVLDNGCDNARVITNSVKR